MSVDEKQRTARIALKRHGKEVMNDLPTKKLPAFEAPRVTSIYGAFGEISLPGDFAEFGVHRGGSARLIDALMTGERRLHLFDSFEGLPEDWNTNRKKGSFKLSEDEIPKFNRKRVSIYKGWFKDTVPEFGKEMTAPLSFIHMDADLYSSTIDVLFNINHLIAPQTVILFDEYSLGRLDEEHRAFCEWAEKFNRDFEFLWRTDGAQVCTRITK